MRSVFIVSYDIADPKRLRKVFRIMNGYGDWLQLSVFQCELGRADRIRLEVRLDEVIKHDEDQVLFLDLGPVKGRGRRGIRALGRPYAPLDRHPVVV